MNLKAFVPIGFFEAVFKRSQMQRERKYELTCHMIAWNIATYEKMGDTKTHTIRAKRILASATTEQFVVLIGAG